MTVVAIISLLVLLPAQSLDAQRSTNHVSDSAPARATVVARKSPTVAGLLGLVLPGAGHWYAKENGRGWAVAAVYWSGVALVAGGRTDAVGKVGGVMLLGALGVSVIDGARAAGRHNVRVGVSAAPTGRGVRVAVVSTW
jgi:hypothetical protein